ncbi:efflux RND transporter periplasmic adaptor subunit [Paraburkholderia elongata]|nr:HlyD family efflux transporter periplasmic adaptor subunit [Paraburkholderia elongata]
MSMHRSSLKTILSGVAIVSFVGGVFLVAKNIRGEQHAPPPVTPPASSFARSIGAEGLVEPKSEDIGVAPVVPGQVTVVRVRAQQYVRAGDVLWEQDSRELAAQIPVREAEVTSARAAVAVGEAALADARVQLTMIENVTDRRAIREEDLQRRRIAADAAKAQLAANRAALTRAEAALAETRSDLTRRVVVAPIDGQILKVNIRPGEYATVPAASPLVVMGDTSAMHMRVDVAEEDAPRFAPERKAYASPRGDASRHIPLEFVRLEPRLIPKRNLSGDTTERIDTRVLQVIYRIAGPGPVYDGELMDVYIDAPALPVSSMGAGMSPASARDRAVNSHEAAP